LAKWDNPLLGIRRYLVFWAMKAMRIGSVFAYDILMLAEREKPIFFFPVNPYSMPKHIERPQ
jgi:hypothetical protein